VNKSCPSGRRRRWPAWNSTLQTYRPPIGPGENIDEWLEFGLEVQPQYTNGTKPGRKPRPRAVLSGPLSEPYFSAFSLMRCRNVGSCPMRSSSRAHSSFTSVLTRLKLALIISSASSLPVAGLIKLVMSGIGW